MIIGSGSTVYKEYIYIFEGYNLTSRKHSNRILVIPTNQNTTDLFNINNEVINTHLKYEFGALIPTDINPQLFVISKENEFFYKFDDITKKFEQYEKFRPLSKGVAYYNHITGILIHGGLLPRDPNVLGDQSKVTDFLFDFFLKQKEPVRITIFDLPPRAYHCMVEVNEVIIIIGGMDKSKQAIGIDTVYVDYYGEKGEHEIKTNGYNDRKLLLHSCKGIYLGFTFLVYKNQIIVFGGADSFDPESYEIGNVYNDILILDTKTWTWTRKEIFNNTIKRAGHTSLLIENQMLIMQGNWLLYIIRLWEWVQ